MHLFLLTEEAAVSHLPFHNHFQKGWSNHWKALQWQLFYLPSYHYPKRTWSSWSYLKSLHLQDRVNSFPKPGQSLLLHSDYSNSASMKWLKSISVVNVGSWQEMLEGVDCIPAKVQVWGWAWGAASPTPEAPAVFRNTKQNKISRDFLVFWVMKAVPASSYRVKGVRNRLLPSMDALSQAEGLYVATMLLLNFSSLEGRI